MFRRCIILLVLILISVSSVYSITREEEMNVGQSVKVNGKTFTFDKFNLDKKYIIVTVDGLSDKFNFVETSKYVNGMKVIVLDYTSYGDDIASFKFNLSVDITCGDMICDPKEDSTICCNDCGCSSGKICEENVCISDKGNECELNKDCNDNDMCSSDFCNLSFIPRECLHFRVFDCRNDDGCCPVGCDSTMDNDCVFIECRESNECNDFNKCTEDVCLNNTCNFNKIESCETEEVIIEEKSGFERYLDITKFNKDFIFFLGGIILLILFILIYFAVSKSSERKK